MTKLLVNTFRGLKSKTKGEHEKWKNVFYKLTGDDGKRHGYWYNRIIGNETAQQIGVLHNIIQMTTRTAKMLLKNGKV